MKWRILGITGQVRDMPRKRSRPIEEPETDPNAEAKAVALRYDMERDKAPKVVAKGKGYVAENIMADQPDLRAMFEGKQYSLLRETMSRLTSWPPRWMHIVHFGAATILRKASLCMANRDRFARSWAVV